MSQVIVTHDNLDEKRLKSAAQEHKISLEDDWQRWKRNDVTKKDPLASGLGLGMLALWGPLCAIMYGSLWVCEQSFKLLGKLLGGTKSLITGK